MDAEHGVDAAQFLWQLVSCCGLLILCMHRGDSQLLSCITITCRCAQVGGNRRLTAHVERRERLAGGGKSWGAQVRACMGGCTGWEGVLGPAHSKWRRSPIFA